jgi:hypothetical protein
MRNKASQHSSPPVEAPHANDQGDPGDDRSFVVTELGSVSRGTKGGFWGFGLDGGDAPYNKRDS